MLREIQHFNWELDVAFDVLDAAIHRCMSKMVNGFVEFIREEPTKATIVYNLSQYQIGKFGKLRIDKLGTERSIISFFEIRGAFTDRVKHYDDFAEAILNNLHQENIFISGKPMTYTFYFRGSLAQYWKALFKEYKRLTKKLGQPPFEFVSPNEQTIDEYAPKDGDEIIIYFWDKDHKRELLAVEAELLPDEEKATVHVFVHPQGNAFEGPVKSAMAIWKEIRKAISKAGKRPDPPKRKRQIENVTNIYGGNIFMGNTNVVNQKIQNSFNKAETADIQAELKETLKQLAQAVEAMSKELPQEQAAEVADDLDKLIEEATKPKPNQKWYSVSIEGLIKAAENLDKLGSPVINLSRKVLSLLTGGIIQ